MSVINTNTKALVAQESMRASNISLSTAMERLSTGSKINSAKDDAAGLAITNRMTAQVRGLAKATNNVNDAISMSQTAEGALGNISDILQRMRELAVQSGTGTMNDSDRSSIQLEVSQLKNQIDFIAKSTNHNNIKLIDGSANSVVIQSGVNAGDTMKIGFASAQTKDIGVGSRATLTSVGGENTTNFKALSASSLYLNGVAVGATSTADDHASSADQDMSAISKVAAINRVSELSGVYAKVGATVASGAKMSAGDDATTGVLSVNGVTIDGVLNSKDTSITRKATALAINAKSKETGVTATDTGSDDTGVTLTATDGRNISVSVTGVANLSSLGIATAGTYVGTYNLYTLDARDINVSFKDGATSTEIYSGLRNGTYKADVAQTTTFIRTTASAGAAPSSSTTGLLNGNSLIINGVAIGQSLATDDSSTDSAATSSTRAASAIAIAAAINRSADQTGVKASAAPNVIRGQGFTAAGTAATVYLNGQSFTVNTTTINGVIDSFNKQSEKTGVVASRWGDGMQLAAADGRNISISTDAASVGYIGMNGITFATTGATAGDAQTFYSQVSLSSDNSFNVRAGSNGIPNLELLGFRQGTFGSADNGLKINQVDISTAGGATQALVAIDAAINSISQQQANSGAVNNRLDSILNNLAESSKNMQASRSRILDTDYATETTNLAKQQIIQQAATAMLAQANQSSQSILSLLK